MNLLYLQPAPGRKDGFSDHQIILLCYILRMQNVCKGVTDKTAGFYEHSTGNGIDQCNKLSLNVFIDCFSVAEISYQSVDGQCRAYRRKGHVVSR